MGDDPTRRLADAARRLEAIEDELATVDGMEAFRERLSNIRADVVEAGLDSLLGAPPEPASRLDHLTASRLEDAAEDELDHATRITRCADCRPSSYTETRKVMEWIALGETDPEDWLCQDHREEMNEATREWGEQHEGGGGSG